MTAEALSILNMMWSIPLNMYIELECLSLNIWFRKVFFCPAFRKNQILPRITVQLRSKFEDLWRMKIHVFQSLNLKHSLFFRVKITILGMSTPKNLRNFQICSLNFKKQILRAYTLWSFFQLHMNYLGIIPRACLRNYLCSTTPFAFPRHAKTSTNMVWESV